MPIHDWTRVETGLFHGFHTRWIGRLAEAIMARLPPNLYADAEQHVDERVADVLTLRVGERGPLPRPTSGAVIATRDQPVQASFHRASDRKPRFRARGRHIVIRSTSGHQIVAMVELVSPSNKDRRLHVADFVMKGRVAIAEGIHLAIIDLFPPGSADPNGLPALVWRRFERASVRLPAGQPLSLASFAARTRPEAFFEFRSVGQEIPDMPLFITDDDYLTMPLRETYQETFKNSPPYVQERVTPPPAGA